MYRSVLLDANLGVMKRNKKKIWNCSKTLLKAKISKYQKTNLSEKPNCEKKPKI